MKLLRSLAGNLATLGLAFVLAIVIWANAVREANPIETDSYQLPITRVVKPDGIVLNQPASTVQIVVSAPQSVLANLSPDVFQAVVDLTNVPFGSGIEVPIQIQSEVEDVRVVDFFPATVVVDMDQQVTREIDVIVEVRGDVARGHEAGAATVEPSRIQVTGPASRVNQLSEARTTVFLEGTRETLVTNRRPLIYDARGNVVSSASAALQLSADEVTITVPVAELSGVREKSITARWDGELPRGYRLLSVNVEPSTVFVTGSPNQLDALRVIETELLDITGLKTTETFRVGLMLPAGVELEQPQPILVEVVVEPIETSSIQSREVEIRGLGPNLTATLSADTVRVFLFGPLEVVDSLLEDDVRVTLDLLGLDEGEYSLEPNVTVSVNNIALRSVQPAQITVLISETVTATEESWLPILPTVAPVTEATGQGVGAGVVLAAIRPNLTPLTRRRQRS